MFKKILLSIFLAIANNINCAHAILDPNRLNISQLTQEEFRKLAEEEIYTCSICLAEANLKEAPENSRLLCKANCRSTVMHVFHKDCIKQITNDLCPLCQESILLPKAPDWFISVECGDINTTRTLINNGINVNTQNDAGSTALMFASGYNHENIVELLIENKANIDLYDNFGNTALMDASAYGHERIVDLLIRNGANVNLRDNDENTALIIATDNNYENIVELLIKNGTCLNLYDKKHNTALIIASSNGYENIVRLLIQNGAIVNLCDNLGRSALIRAEKRGHQNIARLLMMSELPYGLVE